MDGRAVRLDPNALNNLRDMVGDDPEILADLTRTFLEDAPRMMAELERGVQTGDAPLVRLNAHSLKGNATDFGALDFAGLCLEMEMIGKAGDLHAAPPLLGRMQQSYGGVEAALRQLLASFG